MSDQVRDLFEEYKDRDIDLHIFDDDDGDLFDDDLDILNDDDRERTPLGGTPIVLNPKVDGDAMALCCPDCGEEIAAETFKDGAIVEYRCGCEDLKKFKVAGSDG